MTDDVCDSWEDVDVDKIVIKPSSKTKNKKPTYSSILAANSNSCGKTEFIVDDGFDLAENQRKNLLNGSSSSSTFRIVQRVSDQNNHSLPFANQPQIILEDNTRTQFVKGLRILNRPNKISESKNETKLNDEEIQKKLKKSFEEKQAEYAKARLRILGETMPAEDLVLNNMTKAMNNVNLDQSSVSNNTKTKFEKLNIAIETLDNNNQPSIIRQPIAPDGTKGFRNRSKS